MVHIHRPDSHSIEAVAQLSSDVSAQERGILSFVNPTNEQLSMNITVPLYYAGLRPGTVVVVTEAVISDRDVTFTGFVSEHIVGQERAGFTDIIMSVQMDPQTHRMMLIGTK